jgi:hypothetical protein
MVTKIPIQSAEAMAEFLGQSALANGSWRGDDQYAGWVRVFFLPQGWVHEERIAFSYVGQVGPTHRVRDVVGIHLIG